MFRTSTLKLLVGLSLCTLGGAMLYVYFKTKEDEDEVDAIENNGTVTSIAVSSSKKKNSKPMSVQIIVSNEIVPVILGRSGTNIKMIEDKTKTTIRFREKDDNNQYCEINGLPENVNKAKEMLTKEIRRSPNIREEMYVSQSACNKIIGRCGESLQDICRKSLAKVSVASTISNNENVDRNNSSNLTRRVVITGNRKQVNIAKKLIEEKIKENELYRKTLEESESKREPRRSPTNSISSNNSSLTTSLTNFLPQKEKLTMINNDEALEKPMEIYVSAVASPAKFWLQIVGPQSKKLDELVQTMTDYYNDAENQNLHKIADPYLGQIVAALFKYDGKWYRAEIVGILPNEYNPRNVVLDLYFVDYGDSEYVAPNEVYELRTDFLTLRFQAVECYLAHVKPALSNEPDIWDSQSIAKFEELTHVASWKKLISRVVSYKERSNGSGKQSRREGSPVPGVELYDPSEGAEYNIAEVLLSQGYAIPDYTTPKEALASASNDISRLDCTSSVSMDIPPSVTSKNSDPSSSTTLISSSSKMSSTVNGNGDLKDYSYNNGKHLLDESSSFTTTEQNKIKSNTEQLIKNEKFNGNTLHEKKTVKNDNLKKVGIQ